MRHALLFLVVGAVVWVWGAWLRSIEPSFASWWMCYVGPWMVGWYAADVVWCGILRRKRKEGGDGEQ